MNTDSRSLTDKVVELLLSAENVEEFDNVIKMLVLNRGVPVIRNMIENRVNNGNCFGG